MDEAAIVEHLRRAGVKFAYVFGSRAEGTARADSDLDVAAYLPHRADVLEIAGELPGDVDLLLLHNAPLELAGRVAMRGRLLFDDDPPARVHWEATTRRIYLDELPRVEQSRRDFIEGARARGRR